MRPFWKEPVVWSLSVSSAFFAFCAWLLWPGFVREVLRLLAER